MEGQVTEVVADARRIWWPIGSTHINVSTKQLVHTLTQSLWASTKFLLSTKSWLSDYGPITYKFLVYSWASSEFPPERFLPGSFDGWCYGNSESAFGTIPKIKSSNSCLNMSALEKESLVIKTKKISSWGEEHFVLSKKYCLSWTPY